MPVVALMPPQKRKSYLGGCSQDGTTGGVMMIEAFAMILGLIGLVVLAAHALDAYRNG
jgi:hypothetical protein